MSGPRRAALGLLLASALAAAGVAHAVPGPADGPGEGGAPLDELFAREVGGDLMAWLALAALEAGQFVRARELADQLLARDPEAFEGHAVLARVLWMAEGNLPLALYHLRYARIQLERLHGAPPSDLAARQWHLVILQDLASLTGDMDRNLDKLRYVDELESIHGIAYPAARGWPLMRLGRHEEARRASEEGLAMADRPDQQTTGWNTLCALEAELSRWSASYEACLNAIQADRADGDDGVNATYLTNASEAALGMLEMAEAEKLALEATRSFSVGTVSNPWMDLVHLYLAQGRMPEALSALREMFTWRGRQPAHIDALNWSETEMAHATFLVVAGHPVEALVITARAMERPDRTGANSADTAQLLSAAALLDRVASLGAAELAREEASWERPWPALRAWLVSQGRRVRAWLAARRSAALLTDARTLRQRLRPYAPGVAKIPEWIEADLVDVLGPGVVAAALAEARARESVGGAEGYFAALETEIASARGRHDEVVSRADAALAELPRSEVLLRARVAARAAAAALARGQRGRAVQLFEEAMQGDPGVVRRLGLALPARVEAGPGPVAERAARHLRDSPRLRAEGAGFRVRIQEEAGVATACMLTPSGTTSACAQVRPRAGEDADALARRLASELHAAAFAPRVDLTQAELRSLDGYTVAGGRRSDRLRIVIDDVLE